MTNHKPLTEKEKQIIRDLIFRLDAVPDYIDGRNDALVRRAEKLLARLEADA